MKLTRHEDGYLLELKSRRLILFDPEKCLKVGRHDNVLGIVYEVTVPGGTVDHQGEWHKAARGLVREGRTGRRWLEGDPSDLAAAAADTALKLAGMSSPPRWLTAALSASGGKVDWGRPSFWKDLTDKLRLGADLDEVRSVMET